VFSDWQLRNYTVVSDRIVDSDRRTSAPRSSMWIHRQEPTLSPAKTAKSQDKPELANPHRPE